MKWNSFQIVMILKVKRSGNTNIYNLPCQRLTEKNFKVETSSREKKKLSTEILVIMC